MSPHVRPSRAAVAGPGRELPLVWVVVLIYGGEEVTAACIDSLLASDYPRLQVLLVDNASPDGAGVRLRDRYPQIAYLDTGANLGYAGGNNRGMAWALEHRADYVLVINNDTIVEPDCIRLLVDTAMAAPADPPLGLVAPKMLYHDLPDRIWFGGGDISRTRALGMHRHQMERDDASDPAQAVPITFATGCCMLMPAGVAATIGRFDEAFFMYCEDVELSMRLAEAGYRMLYQPGARLYHHEAPGPPQSTPWQLRIRDRNRRRIARMHYGLWERVRFFSFFYPSRAVRLFQYALRRQWSHAAAIWDGTFR